MSIVIVGNGMVGARLCERLAASGWTQSNRVLVFGEESLPAYDRVHLTDLFLGDKGVEQLLLRPAAWYAAAGIELRTKEQVLRIYPEERRVWTSRGRDVAYDRLILATGSRPLLPDVPGSDSPFVCVYRTVEDREAIARCATPGRRIAILGAGLLGIELAAALAQRGSHVSLLERAPRLLPRHLEASAASILSDAVEALGIEVRCGEELLEVTPRSSGVVLQLRDGAPLSADLLVVATGIRPRDELAREAGLACDRRGGIRVDDLLQTSDPNVYAIGECVVHRDTHYGLAAPGFAMADVVDQRLRGIDASFCGVPFSARLKLEGIELSMLGESESGDVETQALTAIRNRVYRRVLVRDSRIIGVTAVGAWPALPRIQEAIARGDRVGARQRRRFERTTELWKNVTTRPIAAWLDAAIVCSCMGVTCGALRSARAQGCATRAELARATGASSVCGTCAPLLAELCGERAVGSRALHGPLLAASISAAVAVVALVVLGPVPFIDSVQLDFAWDVLWRSSLARQITGFSILSVGVASLGLILRKRWRRVSLGSYTSWRSVHAFLGSLGVALAALHTGLSLGANLDFALMLSFVALTSLGAAAGLVTAIERRLEPARGGRLRRAWTLAHLLTLGPFSVLLGFHVLKVYYF